MNAFPWPSTAVVPNLFDIRVSWKMIFPREAGVRVGAGGNVRDGE